MLTEPTQNFDRDAGLDGVIADYLAERAAGRTPDLAEWTQRYPQYANELAEFVADHARLERWVAPAVTLSLPRPPVAAGDVVRYFGDYELLDKIAQGGMGVVYRARQQRLGRLVALKMILAGQLANERDVERFQSEARAAAQLDHPGIVPVYEIGTHEQQHYFSMAFIDGPSLAARLASGPLPPKEAASLVRAVAEAVAYAHSKGVIHRDLKPANILLDAAGAPKVTDFGLARQIDDAGLTASGAILGTPSYMAPEQAAGQSKAVGVTADVYGLGAVLYALLTGRPPFQAATALDTIQQVLLEEPAPPRTLNPQVPRDLETICMKCLEKNPKRRYETAQALAEDLQRFGLGEPVQAQAPTLPYLARAWLRTHSRVVLTAVIVGALVGTLMGTLLWIVSFPATHLLRWYQKFPSESPPLWAEWLAGVQESPVGMGVVHLLLIVGYLFAYFGGWCVVWWGKPAERQVALFAGMVAGLVCGVCFFVTYGNQRVIQLGMQPGLDQLRWVFEPALERFPDLAGLSEEEQRLAVLAKSIIDAKVGTSQAIAGVLIVILVFCTGSFTLQSLLAHSLLQRPLPTSPPADWPEWVVKQLQAATRGRNHWLNAIFLPYFGVNLFALGLTIYGVVLVVDVGRLCFQWEPLSGPQPFGLLFASLVVVISATLIKRSISRSNDVPRFLVHGAILSEQTDLLTDHQYFVVDTVDLTFARWGFFALNAQNVRGILFIKDTQARLIGRTLGGLRVDMTLTRGSAQVTLPPIWHERLRTWAGRWPIYGERAGIRLIVAGQTLYLRTYPLFDIDVDMWDNDIRPETQALFQALSAALQPATDPARANPHSIAQSESVH
jgi:hypothetical protein